MVMFHTGELFGTVLIGNETPITLGWTGRPCSSVGNDRNPYSGVTGSFEDCLIAMFLFVDQLTTHIVLQTSSHKNIQNTISWETPPGTEFYLSLIFSLNNVLSERNYTKVTEFWNNLFVCAHQMIIQVQLITQHVLMQELSQKQISGRKEELMLWSVIFWHKW